MRNFDENEIRIIKARVSGIKEFANQIENVSLPEILRLIDMLQKDELIQNRILCGETAGETFYEFTKSSLDFDKEAIFMLNWCVKGFKGMAECSKNFVKSIEEKGFLDTEGEKT